MKNTLFSFKKKTRNEGIERYQKLDETERICLICVVITCQSMVGYHPSEKKASEFDSIKYLLVFD